MNTQNVANATETPTTPSSARPSPMSAFKEPASAISKVLLGLLILTLASATFTCVCIAQETDSAQDKKVIVCSTTQIADFARQIVGNQCEVVCVLSAAQDPHTYKTTNDDVTSVKRADLCLANGWNLEGNDWMGTMARNQGKPIVMCVNGVKPLVTSDNTHDADASETDADPVYDPHAWFDIDNAMIYVTNIRNAIRDIDPDHADDYNARTKLYLFQLRVLKQWVAQQVNAIPKNRRILVTHHDAFGYFARANGFKAESPAGWSTAEIGGISIENRQQVVKQIRDLGVKSIFVETSTETETLASIAKETGVKIGGELYSDAMGPEGSAGETFIGMIRENVLTIVNSLK